MINRHLHLQHHRHSGSALHHRHTSYRAIITVLAFAGLFMIWLAYYSHNKTPLIGPKFAYEAPAPDGIPFVSSPAVDSVIESDQVKVEGTCAKNVQNFVIIRSSNKITGSTLCSSDGTFSVFQPIISGNNLFTASSSNLSGKETLISIGVSVTGSTGSIINATSVSLNSGNLQYYPKKEFVLPINLSGGSQPYKVSIDWGDNKKEDIETRDSKITLKHTYQSKGEENIKLSVEGDKTKPQNYSFVAVDAKDQQPSKASPVAFVSPGSGGGASVTGFITAFAFGLYMLALVIVLPFVRSSKYVPEMIDSDNNDIFED